MDELFDLANRQNLSRIIVVPPASFMVFEHIEKLKREYTDKYVVVDRDLPELKRFANMTGVVRTVNMSGRALVEFDGLNNTGWYDINVDFLKVVDKPVPKPVAEKKPAVKKPTATGAAAKPGASAADILAAARAQKGDAPAKPEAKKPTLTSSTADILAAARAKKAAPSTADILAAARAKKEEAPAKPEVKKPASGPSTADILAAARAKKSPAPTSTADILAAARAQKQDSSEPAAAKPSPAPVSTADILAAARAKKAPPVPTEEAPVAKVEPAAPERAVVEENVAPVKAANPPAGALPTATAEIIAYCRQRDA